MLTHISLEPEAMVDPRGEFRRQPVRLAPRLANLNGKTVMLFDNTQMTSQVAVYGPIFQWLSDHLQSEHHANSLP